MDPMTLAMIGSMIGGGLGIGGKPGEFGSTYTKGQRNTIDDILQQVR